jgi:UDP-N-acetylmuramate dehydrogenase
MTILENYSLTSLNTFKIESKARYFAIIKNENDLVEAAFFIRNKKIPFFVLGGGSNILLPDDGYKGMILKIEILGRDLQSVSKGVLKLGAGAGENWDDLVAFAVKNNLAGLETLSGIPGTVGASPVQNIGAYGSEAKDTIFSVETFDMEKMTRKTWSAVDCNFGYRNSVFKLKENKKYVVTKVYYNLCQNGTPNIEYKDVKKYFDDRLNRHPSILQVREAVLEIRKGKIPNPQEVGNAGSFFKNPIIGGLKYNELKKTFPELPHYPLSDGQVKIPLAYVLDKICHIKGLKYGKVGLYDGQPLVLVNLGGATAQEIKRFAQTIVETVKNSTGLDVECEVEEI